jgi:cell division protein ZipA
MDISLRMWLFIILGVLILGILLDAIRRWRQHRRNPYIDGLGTIKIDVSGDDPFRHEFPSGGPRPVDPEKLKSLFESDSSETSPIVDQAEIETVLKPMKEAKSESFFSRHTKSKVPETERPAVATKKATKPEQLDLTSVPMLIDPITITEEANESFDTVDETHDSKVESSKVISTTPVEEENELQEAIVLNMFSRDANGFQGEVLLEVLLGSGLRYGDMSIFHRHQSPAGEGKVLFSVANAMNPGTFKIEAMNKFSTKGLSFFFGLPGPVKPMENFNLMLETAQYLTKRLNGELKDDKRSVLTVQTIEHYRQRIRDFERRHLAQ